MFNWLFGKGDNPEHTVQVEAEHGVIEAYVYKTETGLVYFVMDRWGSRDKCFINEKNEITSKRLLLAPERIIPLSWPVDEPCPLFTKDI